MAVCYLLNAAAYAEQAKSNVTEHMQILGSHDKFRTQGGATSVISEALLTQFEFDDINKVLANVPGVNLREEDGYGLRPNIGFRGATPERSRKISLLEDGILISPAPYSAPSAYYFPMVSRMTAVEVFKGPAAIQYGPNTVAGALNLVTRSIPEYAETGLDLAYGSDQYQKIHAYYGNTLNDFGFLIEGLQTQADGFKNIEFSDKTTGFDKSDVMAKLSYDLSDSETPHYIELKLAYADETSNETYLGLSDEDFAESPYSRYAASAQDQMNWDHQTYQLTHFVRLNQIDILTRIYRHDFSRDWRKVSGFGQNTPSLLDVLSDPISSEHATYYQRLKGANSGDIILGTNDRSYRSQGIQLDLDWQFELSQLVHQISLGARLHKDSINRDHYEQTYSMDTGAQMTLTSDKTYTTVNLEEASALSLYLQDTVKVNKLTLTAGLRSEIINSSYRNRTNSQDWLEKKSRIWLPSLNAFYQLSDTYGVFAGLHQGYVPSSPQQNDESVDAEKSLNYEIGFRQNNRSLNSEFVIFYNDYSNLKESCSFSQSSNCPLDSDFNGGDVRVYGFESQVSSIASLTSTIDVPWSVTYSYVKSEFETSFESDYPQWGHVSAGDAMPYQPEHSLTTSLGLRATDWQISAQIKYTDKINETAGSGTVLSGHQIPASIILDVSANYSLNDQHNLYAKIDNLTDQVDLVSRRPSGARPNRPRSFVIGYKFNY